MLKKIHEKKKIQDLYNVLSGRLYDIRYKEEQLKKFEKILEYQEISSNQIMIDVGCGTGLLSDILNSSVIGLDISSSLLKTAMS